jgi:hypothetical protein
MVTNWQPILLCGMINFCSARFEFIRKPFSIYENTHKSKDQYILFVRFFSQRTFFLNPHLVKTRKYSSHGLGGHSDLKRKLRGNVAIS